MDFFVPLQLGIRMCQYPYCSFFYQYNLTLAMNVLSCTLWKNTLCLSSFANVWGKTFKMECHLANWLRWTVSGEKLIRKVSFGGSLVGYALLYSCIISLLLQVNCILNFIQFVFNQPYSLKTKGDADLIWHFIALAPPVTNVLPYSEENVQLILPIEFQNNVKK